MQVGGKFWMLVDTMGNKKFIVDQNSLQITTDANAFVVTLKKNEVDYQAQSWVKK